MSGTTAVAYLSHLERDNRFCIACHSADGKRPHGELFERYEAKPPVNLSAVHWSAKKAVECIDCHGGVGGCGEARSAGAATRRWARSSSTPVNGAAAQSVALARRAVRIR